MDAQKNREYQARWYKQNKEKQIERTRLNRLRIREYILEVRHSSKCTRCPETHISTLDFHHKDGEIKEGSIANAHTRGWSIEKVKREIQKCEILCSNCHRKEHYTERQGVRR